MQALDEYLARIGYDGPRAATPAALADLHEAHALAIPFENLDIQLGRPIRLAEESLVDKLVTQRRGGYCFEQNGLLAAALEALGFGVVRLAARVRLGATQLLPRTHMLLEVEAGGLPYIADVGFGVDGLYRPIPLHPGEYESAGDHYRIEASDGVYVLSAERAGSWLELYAFTREPHHAVDFELASWYTSTHPQSRFVTTLTAQRLEPGRRSRLRDRELVVTENGQETRAEIASPEELVDVLAHRFGLEFPAGTRFRNPVF
jgi:N-hydroxyarylamine O-acetyltransferase